MPTRVQTPRGVKDILPREAYYKSRIQRQAGDFVEGWGYRRVITPTFEYFDVLAQGDQQVLTDQLYRFVDRDGNTLALRPEMTTSIARLVATRYRPEQMPVRLHYIGSVFRHDEPQAGRQREFTQVGVELIGVSGKRADGEVITLAAGLLDELGLASFRIDLGHTDFFLGLVGDAESELVEALRDALLHRDLVRYKTIVDESPLSEKRVKALRRLPFLRGAHDEIDAVVSEGLALADGAPGALSAIDDLTAVIELVRAYGFSDRIGIDLGMMKDLDYYSGLQMEGYVPELGFTLCTGGRYDRLIGGYGFDASAIGFALGVERVMLALDRQRRNDFFPPASDLLLYGDDADDEALFEAASRVRSKGFTVEIDVSGDYLETGEDDLTGGPSEGRPGKSGDDVTYRHGEIVFRVAARVRRRTDGELQFSAGGEDVTLDALCDKLSASRQGSSTDHGLPRKKPTKKGKDER